MLWAWCGSLTQLLAFIPAAELWCCDAFKVCHVACSMPHRNPSHKRVLKASIRGSQRLAWDNCTYYGDSLNQQIWKLQIPHQTKAICRIPVDQCLNKYSSPSIVHVSLKQAAPHHPDILTIFSLSFASSSGASSPVPVVRRPQEIAVLVFADKRALMVLGLMGAGRRGWVWPPVPPVCRGPVGFALFTEAFLLFVAFQSVHHFNSYL